MNTKIDIVLQGPYSDFTDVLLDHYLKLHFVNNVIVSCWNGDKEPPRNLRKVKYIKNEYPTSPGTDNKNLQIVSSINGLRRCETDFSVKIRSDQKFTHDSMLKMYDFFMQNNQKSINYQYDSEKPKGKIFVAGVYPSLLFAIRDHIFWGNTNDLIDLFDIPLEQNSLIDIVKVPKERLANYYQYFTRTETYIGAHYCANFMEEINKFLLLPKEHLYDGAIYWYYAKEISDQIIPFVFKSFPKEIIDLDWVRWRKCGFDFNLDHYRQASFWHEDGF